MFWYVPMTKVSGMIDLYRTIKPMHVFIEVGGWCVTLYENQQEGITVDFLKLFYGAARKKGFAAGCVDVFPYTSQSQSEGTVPYVTVLRCNEEDAKAILLEMGVESCLFEVLGDVE